MRRDREPEDTFSHSLPQTFENTADFLQILWGGSISYFVLIIKKMIAEDEWLGSIWVILLIYQ